MKRNKNIENPSTLEDKNAIDFMQLANDETSNTETKMSNGKFDQYMSLANFYITQYNERRKYEFSNSIVIWTSLTALTYLIVTSTGLFNEMTFEKMLISIASALIATLIHWYFVVSLAISNTMDSLKAHRYLDYIALEDKSFSLNSNPVAIESTELPNLMNLEISYDKKIAWLNWIKSKGLKKYLSKELSWAQITQILITVSLAFGIITSSIISHNLTSKEKKLSETRKVNFLSVDKKEFYIIKQQIKNKKIQTDTLFIIK